MGEKKYGIGEGRTDGEIKSSEQKRGVITSKSE